MKIKADLLLDVNRYEISWIGLVKEGFVKLRTCVLKGVLDVLAISCLSWPCSALWPTFYFIFPMEKQDTLQSIISEDTWSAFMAF